ncbi:MAG: polysaccharide deacetylase family protein [Bacteroidia bacterium]
MFQYRLPLFVKYLIPHCTWKVNTSDKVLYLTFDDGPHPEITNYVLNLLEKYNAKATFFCVGENVKKYPDVYERILNKGHTTGNHTFHHVNFLKTNRKNYLHEIELASQYIKSDLFRPPYGKILPKTAKIISKNYKIMMWSLLTRDYDKDLDLNAALNQIYKAKNGDILVFHDSEKAFKNLQLLLPKTLDFYYQKGYSFNALK